MGVIYNLVDPATYFVIVLFAAIDMLLVPFVIVSEPPPKLQILNIYAGINPGGVVIVYASNSTFVFETWPLTLILSPAVIGNIPLRIKTSFEFPPISCATLNPGTLTNPDPVSCSIHC